MNEDKKLRGNKVKGEYILTIRVDSDDWLCWDENLSIEDLKKNIIEEVMSNINVLVKDMMKDGCFRVLKDKMKFWVTRKDGITRYNWE